MPTMPTIQSQAIDKLCTLAQLALDAAERQHAGEDLARIIAMVDAMAAVDTDGVAPLSHPLDAVARLREDEVNAEIDRDAFQALAPAVADGLYLVPRVVE